MALLIKNCKESDFNCNWRLNLVSGLPSFCGGSGSGRIKRLFCFIGLKRYIRNEYPFFIKGQKLGIIHDTIKKVNEVVDEINRLDSNPSERRSFVEKKLNRLENRVAKDFDKMAQDVDNLFSFLLSTEEPDSKTSGGDMHQNQEINENANKIESQRNLNYKKGMMFEQYIATLFSKNRNLFVIEEWTTDHCDKRSGIYVESDSNPDLLIRYKPSGEKFAVECKWRAKLVHSEKYDQFTVLWSNPEQIQRYNQYSQSRNIPIFIIIGLEGRPDDPKYTYCLPLDVAQYPEIPLSVLKRYKRISPGSKFNWDKGNLN
jgi:hypothetical protein